MFHLIYYETEDKKLNNLPNILSNIAIFNLVLREISSSVYLVESSYQMFAYILLFPHLWILANVYNMIYIQITNY